MVSNRLGSAIAMNRKPKRAISAASTPCVSGRQPRPNERCEKQNDETERIEKATGQAEIGDLVGGARSPIAANAAPNRSPPRREETSTQRSLRQSRQRRATHPQAREAAALAARGRERESLAIDWRRCAARRPKMRRKRSLVRKSATARYCSCSCLSRRKMGADHREYARAGKGRFRDDRKASPGSLIEPQRSWRNRRRPAARQCCRLLRRHRSPSRAQIPGRRAGRTALPAVGRGRERR